MSEKDLRKDPTIDEQLLMDRLALGMSFERIEADGTRVHIDPKDVLVTGDEEDEGTSSEPTMIERVARAIETVPVMAGTYSMSGEDAVALARAAIEAMRTPTDAMIEAGYDAADDAITHPGAESVFEAMIDAALNERANAR